MLRKTPLRPKREKPRRKGTPAPRIKPGREEDPERLAMVRKLPCSVCGLMPSEAHHIRDGQVGTGQKASDYDTIPLCLYHHRLGLGAIHQIGTRAWEERFGPQRDHLDKTDYALMALHIAEIEAANPPKGTPWP